MPDMVATEFIRLNSDWNAEPNAPEPRVSLAEDLLTLEFYPNAFAYTGFRVNETVALKFIGCRRYHLAGTNDEGFYMGQCRFSKLAPAWGEFYEIKGDLLLDKCASKWIDVNLGKGTRHFLFYFRDEAFECDADDFEFVGHNKS